MFDTEWKLIPGNRTTAFKNTFTRARTTLRGSIGYPEHYPLYIQVNF